MGYIDKDVAERAKKLAPESAARFLQEGGFLSKHQSERVFEVRDTFHFAHEALGLPNSARLDPEVRMIIINQANAMSANTRLIDVAKMMGLITPEQAGSLYLDEFPNRRDPDFDRLAGNTIGEIMVLRGVLTEEQVKEVENVQTELMARLDKELDYPAGNRRPSDNVVKGFVAKITGKPIEMADEMEMLEFPLTIENLPNEKFAPTRQSIEDEARYDELITSGLTHEGRREEPKAPRWEFPHH